MELFFLVVSLDAVIGVFADTLGVIRLQLTLLMELTAGVHHFPYHDTSCIQYAAFSFAQHGWVLSVTLIVTFIQL